MPACAMHHAWDAESVGLCIFKALAAVDGDRIGQEGMQALSISSRRRRTRSLCCCSSKGVDGAMSRPAGGNKGESGTRCHCLCLLLSSSIIRHALIQTRTLQRGGSFPRRVLHDLSDVLVVETAMAWQWSLSFFYLPIYFLNLTSFYLLKKCMLGRGFAPTPPAWCLFT